MITEKIKITDKSVSTKEVDAAAHIIKDGGLVVFPTESVYGLGADATRKDAAKKIYAAKGRPSDNPLIIHVAHPEDAERYCFTNSLFYKLAKRFMPGPLTVILPKKEIIPSEVTGGLDTVAVRCPSHPVAHALIKACGVPIAAPSANISGKPSPTTAAHVSDDMDGRVDMIIDGGECEIGLESTIIKLDGDSVVLLRPGAITYDALSCVCDNITVSPAILEKLGENERPLSPGMKYKHYAPNAPFVLLDGKYHDVISFLKNEQSTKSCAILCFSEDTALLENKYLFDIGMADDLPSHAKHLFKALRDADKCDVDIIYAHLPKPEGLGLALYNRMIRAAAHTVKKI